MKIVSAIMLNGLKWQQRMDRNNIGRDFEKALAKKVRGRETIASGALWFSKEDVTTPGWIFQAKATKNESYSLKLSDLKKLASNAKKTNRKWALAFQFKAGEFDSSVYFALPQVYYAKSQQLYDKLINLSGELLKAKKQTRLSKEYLEEQWLNDKLVVIRFDSFNEYVVIRSELDFFNEMLKYNE